MAVSTNMTINPKLNNQFNSKFLFNNRSKSQLKTISIMLLRPSKVIMRSNIRLMRLWWQQSKKIQCKRILEFLNSLSLILSRQEVISSTHVPESMMKVTSQNRGDLKSFMPYRQFWELDGQEFIFLPFRKKRSAPTKMPNFSWKDSICLTNLWKSVVNMTILFTHKNSSYSPELAEKLISFSRAWWNKLPDKSSRNIRRLLQSMRTKMTLIF